MVIHSSTKVPNNVREFANKDIKYILDKVNKFSEHNEDDLNAQLADLKFDTYDNEVVVTAVISYNLNGVKKQQEYILNYSFDGDDVWLEYTNNAHARWLYSRLCNPGSYGKGIKASTSARRRPIMAADEDDPGFGDFEDEGAEFDGDDGFGDTLDDMADSIEELQDDVDEIQEDDVNIDVDNNIDNHYIAECNRCHGIFISAMIESDQEVEKVTGVCPLCEKESDQYLKWVIHAVE